MKRFLLPALLILTACGQPEPSKKKAVVPVDPDIKINKGPDYEFINNCLRTTLSYKLQVEPRDYDSIATYYFHEIRDYEDKEIRLKNQKLKRLKNNLKDSLSLMSEDRRNAIEGEIDVLQQEVNAHFKDVIGYVFVHSFRIKEKDTMSAIYVMDNKCGFKEFIRVKVISDPNPEDYIESIRSIER